MSAELFTTLLVIGIFLGLYATVIGLSYNNTADGATHIQPTRRERAEKTLREVEARLRIATASGSPPHVLRRQEIESLSTRLNTAKTGLMTDDWLASALAIEALDRETAPTPPAIPREDPLVYHTTSSFYGGGGL